MMNRVKADPSQADSSVSKADSSWATASSDTDLLTAAIVCPPSYYPIERFEQATWRARGANRRNVTLADLQAEHQELVHVLVDAGVKVYEMPATPGCVFQTFTRDACVVLPTGPVLAAPGSDERRPDVAPLEAYLADLGLVAERICPSSNGTMEGGDVHLLSRGQALIGINGRRTNASGAKSLAAALERSDVKTLVYQFPGPHHHFDMGFSMVAEGLCVADERQVSDELKRFLRRRRIEVLYFSGDEAEALACNVLSLGNGRALSSAHAVAVNRALRAYGIEVYTPDIERFAVDGGSVRCLTLPLRRIHPVAYQGARHE